MPERIRHNRSGKYISMTTLSNQVCQRLDQMLKTAFGDIISKALKDSHVTEIMVNPDGTLWIETLSKGRINSMARIEPEEIERIIRLVAGSIATDITDTAPIISAELPGTGERFEGLLPPIALAPLFCIRKPADRILTLDDYSAAGVMTASQKSCIQHALGMRSNILIAGGTGSGKTTLANALLADIARHNERIIILEDTRELHCASLDCVSLRTRAGFVSLTDLVRSTLRLRPDRIIVGEVRGAEALDMLKSWNTGHPGGISTIHANSASGALYRLEQLILEAIPTIPKALIAQTIDLIIFVAGRGSARRISELVEVRSIDAEDTYQLASISTVEDLTTGEAS